MQEQEVATRKRSIAAFILWGAVGFGIGGAIGGTIAVDAAIFLGFSKTIHDKSSLRVRYIAEEKLQVTDQDHLKGSQPVHLQ